jgi:predicted GNAT family acetyltransferase
VELAVVDNPGSGRFEARADDGSVAGFIDYVAEGDTIVLVHTEVGEEYAGQGVGARLVADALGLLKDRSAQVVNQCPFIKRFIARHPHEYDWVG